ncbi:class I SAM-dependent methyltransferase [uncultured Roseobacter sp.]|uniref:class I SAM-dependent methyltransferase n=1 Tax=uncultured Roseobacter sp. TaxID=114847 RepID=UPI00262B711C|nr:class I SAM-dependent methyltransferase [uncultured Roseobacter sp.]
MPETCTICGSAETGMWYRGDAVRTEWAGQKLWDVQRCHTCGHQFTAPRPSDAELGYYYSSGYSPHTFGYGVRATMDTVIKTARETGYHRHVRITSGMDVLDVGCGGGTFLAVCQAMGADIQGVEPSADGASTCRDNNIPVHEGFLDDYLGVADRRFDLITANHVVEHHAEPVRLLREMKSLLKPDGKIWFSVPNAGCHASRLLKDRWHSSDLPVHLQHFTPHSVRRMIAEAGLSLTTLKTESENSLPGSYANLLRRKLGVPGRLTRMIAGPALQKNAWLGRRIDASGNGEAIITEAA